MTEVTCDDSWQKPIVLAVKATAATFDESGYLDANPDVRAAVVSGLVPTGRAHFDSMGYREGRLQRLPATMLDRPREIKLKRLEHVLRTDMPKTIRDGRADYLSDALRAATHIVDTDNVSANAYDAATMALIERHRDGLVLDCGAGRREKYYHNVINFEIVNYDTTDVLGVGEDLPFKDSSFDAIISIAVLEHVRDPFRCAQEIARVLKPGGELLCAVPFLQPLHGYPHHYFNATHQGLRRLFEDYLDIVSVDQPFVGHPAFTLHWFLNIWLAGLMPEARETFLNAKINDLISDSAADLAAKPYGNLAPAQAREIACAFVLTARKARQSG